MNARKQSTGLQILIGIVIVGLLTGCASVFQDLDDKMNRKRFKKDFDSLEAALEVYDQGDFNKALVHFKKIKVASENETVGRRAWLGEICCYLMLAKGPDEYTKAVGMWHAFQEATTEEDAIWSEALFDPLIVRQTPRIVSTVIQAPAAPPPAIVAAPATVPKQANGSQERPTDSSAEMEELKKKARRADQLQLKMAKIQAENRSLKEKIKALEAIDQIIQKKKTEISTSGE